MEGDLVEHCSDMQARADDSSTEYARLGCLADFVRVNRIEEEAHQRGNPNILPHYRRDIHILSSGLEGHGVLASLPKRPLGHANELSKQRVWSVGPGKKLRMELHADHEGLVGHLHDLHEPPVRRETGWPQADRLQLLFVGVVDLEPVSRRTGGSESSSRTPISVASSISSSLVLSCSWLMSIGCSPGPVTQGLLAHSGKRLGRLNHSGTCQNGSGITWRGALDG